MTTIRPELLENAVERLRAEFQPEEIYLFGSHAWGNPTDDSDVDLMVILPSSEERPIRRMQRAQRCLRGIGFAKDVLVNTRAEFDRYRHVSASLTHKIFREGRRLYGKTPYSVAYRYPDEQGLLDPSRDEFVEALSHSQAIYEFVKQLLPS